MRNPRQTRFATIHLFTANQIDQRRAPITFAYVMPCLETPKTMSTDTIQLYVGKLPHLQAQKLHEKSAPRRTTYSLTALTDFDGDRSKVASHIGTLSVLDIAIVF